MPTSQEYFDGTQKVLDDSQKQRKPYLTTVADKEFWVAPNVFSPQFFRDTEIFARNFPYRCEETFLEIGAGTGAIGIHAALHGARQVHMTEINWSAFVTCLGNIEFHGLRERVRVWHGDAYEPLPQEAKYDTIWSNVPFGYVPAGKRVSDLQKAVFDPGYETNRRIIMGAKARFSRCGEPRLLIGFSSTLGHLELLQEFCKEAGLEPLKLLYEEESVETYPVKFEIFGTKPRGG